MKLVIAAEIFPPDIGGPATYSKKIAEELTKRGWDVKLLCYSDKKQLDNFDFKIYRIIRSQVKGWHHFKYFFRLLFLSFSCDLIYAQGPVSSGLPALKIKKLLGKKLVIKIVGDYAWEQARNLEKTDLSIDDFQNSKFSGKIGWLRKIERQVCQGADKIIVPSQYLKKIVIGWGIEKNKIQVIYNAKDEAEIIPEPKTKNTGEQWLVTVARLVPWKGIDTLIKLMPDLIKEIPNLKLKIVGQGPDDQKLRELVINLNLGEAVELTGKKSHDEVLAYIQAADLFILNSGYEGLSHVILEALSFNKSVLASNIGGNPEIIIPGKTGKLFEYNNSQAIKESVIDYFKRGGIDNSLLKSELRADFFSQFTFEKMINNTILTLSSVK